MISFTVFIPYSFVFTTLMCFFLRVASNAELTRVNLQSVSAGTEIWDWEQLLFLLDKSIEMEDVRATLIYN